jgi:hypothetical protein
MVGFLSLAQLSHFGRALGLHFNRQRGGHRRGQRHSDEPGGIGRFRSGRN